MRSLRLLCGTAALVLLTGGLAAPAAGAKGAPAETWRTVEHNVTLPPQYFEDELCGQGTFAETQVNRLQMQQLTARADGSFSFTDFETGITVIDFVDPQYQDFSLRRTNTFHLNLTRGGTVTVTETLRESDGNLTATYRYHLTEVAGEIVVEREVGSFTMDNCPG